jgi:hypothetical protein
MKDIIIYFLDIIHHPVFYLKTFQGQDFVSSIKADSVGPNR